jgi:hypothetical protein
MTVREWLLLIVTTLVGLGGLFFASSPSGGASYGLGLAIFGVALIYAFVLIKQYFDRLDSGRR